jgi:[ribosomal protein S18]-alanine N-acetyltransferase
MKIKEASENDMEDLCEIEMSSGYHKENFDFKPFLKKLFYENAKIFYIKENCNFVGYVTLSKCGEISFLAVSKKFQRRGKGDILLRKVISYAKKRKLKKLFLDVRNNNLPAIRLYLKKGFMVTKLYKKKIDNKEITKLRLEKSL